MAAVDEQFLPVLSAGRHRNARRGACFMEYASFLAGLRWSDHPECTHPSLAAMARLINDLTSDGTRSRLATHVSSVIGLDGDDPRVPVILSTLAAASALPVASEARQHALATALVRCRRLLEQWDDAVADRARLRIQVAFLMTPGSEGWANSFIRETSLPASLSLDINDEAILRTAIIGIADACVSDADARLEKLLVDAIRECSSILTPDAVVEEATPVQELTLA